MTRSAKSWKESILRLVLRYPPGSLLTSDQLRVTAHEKRLGHPRHPNGWGAVVQTAAKRKLIEKTGRYFPSLIPSNHGAVIAEWRRI